MIEYITKRKDVSMDKVNIIYDHYKDTYNIQCQNEKTRNNLFIALCICILLLMLMIVYPNNIYTNIKEIFLDKMGVNIMFELSIVECFLWFVILYITVRYYQINANIEKNYKYIHALEEKLETKYKLPFSREGKNYLNQYPLFLTFSYIFYKYLFPIIFTACILTKVICHIVNGFNIILLHLIILICLCLIVLNESYFLFNYSLRNKSDKNDKN